MVTVMHKIMHLTYLILLPSSLAASSLNTDDDAFDRDAWTSRRCRLSWRSSVTRASLRGSSPKLEPKSGISDTKFVDDILLVSTIQLLSHQEFCSKKHFCIIAFAIYKAKKELTKHEIIQSFIVLSWKKCEKLANKVINRVSTIYLWKKNEEKDFGCRFWPAIVSTILGILYFM